MPAPDPGSLADLVPGVRATLRRRFPDGYRDVVGFVVTADATTLCVEDRHGATHVLRRDEIVAGHRVGVARGRDPLRAPLPEAELAALPGGAAAGLRLVCRLSDLLDERVPPAAVDEPTAAWVVGEWLVCEPRPDLVGVAWWGARRGARSLLVLACDATASAGLADLGLVQRR
jgi:hypothetical protein